MSTTDSELNEFISEATDMLNDAEKCLLSVEKGALLSEHYDSIFRSFHSIKGASGMLELNDLQQHMHKLEHFFQELKNNSQVPKSIVSFLLKAIDAAHSKLKGEISTFDFNSEAQPVSAEPQANGPKLPLIYVIDDEPMLTEVLTDILSSLNLTVKVFNDPKVAISSFENDLPVIVATDMKMPGLTGMEVLKKIKAIEKNTLVIFISGYLTKEDVIESIGNGVYSVIEKPFNTTQVLTTFTSALEKQKMDYLLNKSFELLLFQIKDLETYMLQNNKAETFTILKNEIDELLKLKRSLNQKKP